jgi:glycerol uptake facilitator-like aquaporin
MPLLQNRLLRSGKNGQSRLLRLGKNGPREMKSGAARAWAGEFLGTALLLAGVVGSGIMAVRLADGNLALALLANALATGFLLPVLIQLFGPISGAHFNPLVTLTEAANKQLPWSRVTGYVVAQISGAWVGVCLAHAMFGLELWQMSSHARNGMGQGLSEGVATFGLILLILRRDHCREGHISWLIGAYIAAAYWFTASTSFANPAVTLARAFTNTFSGIRLADVPGFVVFQIVGTVAACFLDQWMRKGEEAKNG